MRLNWRDAVGSVLVAGAVAVTLAVGNGWGWPLLGDARAGVIALLLLGYASCLVTQAPQRMARAIRHETGWSPFIVVASVLGAAAVVLTILGLLTGSLPVLVYLTAVVVATWAVSTLHHAVEGELPGSTR